MPALTHHLNNFFTRPGQSLNPGSKIALAVSGGVDSMALLHLFHAWAKDKQLSAIVITVDHGLRKESAAEAAFVAHEAIALGYRHCTLPWLGDKPTSGIQSAARAARYRLIEEFMTREGCDTLLTAHTRDDQAETVWMRLKRGTGIDGLAGMRPARKLPNGATHLRPLL
ncbi:MAG: tRNA lysidine(34) synthetase TilS, partial [Hyphomicrobiaceae bacterium]